MLLWLITVTTWIKNFPDIYCLFCAYVCFESNTSEQFCRLSYIVIRRLLPVFIFGISVWRHHQMTWGYRSAGIFEISEVLNTGLITWVFMTSEPAKIIVNTGPSQVILEFEHLPAQKIHMARWMLRENNGGNEGQREDWSEWNYMLLVLVFRLLYSEAAYLNKCNFVVCACWVIG